MPLARRRRANQLPLPYGTADLDPAVRVLSQQPRRVRCYVRGCRHQLLTPRRGFSGDVCPVHGIRCHHSSAGSTYSYPDVRRNIIASAELFAARVVGHPFKYESHRLGSENSEDALSWNVFRSLAEAGALGRVAALVTGEMCEREPQLYLWGINASGDELVPWPLLVAARGRFESNLPVERPLTEPDIALHLPGKYLILIEAKFTSPNTFYRPGSRKDDQSLTFAELLEIYHDPQLKILDHASAVRSERVAYQLWRNTVFAEWMARRDHPLTKAYHVNLVRSGYERESAAQFGRLVSDSYKDRFCRLTWERVYEAIADHDRLSRLRQYLQTKTARLEPALKLPAPNRRR